MTPLHELCFQYPPNIANCNTLLEQKANINALNCRQQTPLDEAISLRIMRGDPLQDTFILFLQSNGAVSGKDICKPMQVGFATTSNTCPIPSKEIEWDWNLAPFPEQRWPYDLHWIILRRVKRHATSNRPIPDWFLLYYAKWGQTNNRLADIEPLKVSTHSKKTKAKQTSYDG